MIAICNDHLRFIITAFVFSIDFVFRSLLLDVFVCRLVDVMRYHGMNMQRAESDRRGGPEEQQ